MTDAYTKSSVYLRNAVETSPVTVTPILYLSNGVKLSLSPVTLQPAGTTVININDSLAGQGIAPYASLSGYIELQYVWPWDALCATVSSVDTTHSTIFTYGLHPLGALGAASAGKNARAVAGPQTLEGAWWKEEPGITGFVALSNTTDQPLQVSVQVTDAEARPLGVYEITVSAHGTKRVELQELTSLVNPLGGVQVTFNGPPDALIVNGSLEDPSKGYSASIPFATPPSSSAKPGFVSYAEIGLMTGQADPMMHFPVGTVFTPYSVVRNLNSQPVAVTPTLWWMGGTGAASASLPAFTLAALQTKQLDMPALLSIAGLKNFNGSVNLVLQFQGAPGSVIAASGSVDKSENYVFEVVPRGVGESASKGLSYWSTANGDDTMVTLWNPADEPQDFVFTVFFAGGHYLYPIHLEPRATHMFSMSELIQNQLPDSEGNVIPLSVREGSGKISGSVAENEHILLVMDAGTYNVRKATCVFRCITCNGAVAFLVFPNPLAIPVSGTSQMSMKARWNTGNTYDITSASSWSSSNTSVATVDQTALTQGVAVGNVLIAGSDPDEPLGGQDCNYYPSCANDMVGGGGSGPVNVNPSVYFSNTPVVPLGGTAPISATVTNNTNNTTITLQLITVSGTGSATFGNGQTTMTITQSTILVIVGVQASSQDYNIQLSASIPSEGSVGILATTNFTVTATNGAVPVNFRQTAAYVNPGAVLHFEYSWDSSSGNIADLQSCQVEENVTYVGPNPFVWASPPYLHPPGQPNYTTPWPEHGDTPISANQPSPGMQDNHGHVPGWQTPYVFNYAGSDQAYQFQCPYYRNNQWVQLMPLTGTMPIGRVVNLTNGSPPWTYQITKSGLTGSLNLP